MLGTEVVEKIRMKQRYMQLLSELLVNFKSYINEVARKKFGETPRFLTLNRIETVEKIGSKGLQLVTAQFQTELGGLTLSIAIKEFNQKEEAKKNRELTKLIAQRLYPSNNAEIELINVSTPRVLLRYDATLIYEGILGETFRDCELDHFEKLELTGKALAKYHSSEIKPADSDRYIFLVTKVLEQLPVPVERKNKYLSRAVELVKDSVSLINSGTAVFGDFHRENVMFSIDKEAKGKNYVQTWLIDPEYAEAEKNADRMEDIATFFLHQAIDSYQKEKKGDIQRDESLEKLKTDLEHLFKGYDSFLAMHHTSLQQLYSNKLDTTFAFHLGLSALMEALFAVKRGSVSNQETVERISMCLGLANRCWTKGLNWS
ncbi:MAG: hypothetical protein ACFFD4_29305 [Candidatus Odinarchaeota archaeon]